MSKKECENQSGATLAAAIIDKSGGKFSEKANINRDYEKIFKRNFNSDFSKYYELLTNDSIKLGKIPKEQFDDLQTQLVWVTRKYCIDDLCQWFRVEKWQDLFPNDYENKDELNFKEEMYKLIIDFYKIQEKNEKEEKDEKKEAEKDKEEQNETEKGKIEKSEKDVEVKSEEEQEKIVKNKITKVKKGKEEILEQYENDMIKVKEMIYKLMKMDYEYHYQKKCHNSKNKMILNIADVERELKNIKQIEEEQKYIKKKQEEKENQQIAEAIEIINHIKLGTEPIEKSNEFRELYKKCKEKYLEEKIDFDKVNILEWVRVQREKISMQ